MYSLYLSLYLFMTKNTKKNFKVGEMWRGNNLQNVDRLLETRIEVFKNIIKRIQLDRDIMDCGQVPDLIREYEDSTGP